MNLPTSERTIGLFGGSFNPPHVAHVCVAAWALSVGKIDELWVIPTGGHPFGKDLAPFHHRIEMCRLAFSIFAGRVEISDAEQDDKVHYSVDTLKRLVRDTNGAKFRWVIGSDALAQKADWKDFDEIERLAPLLIVGRDGAAETKHGDGTFSLPNISSTAIRERIASSQFDSLTNLVPIGVVEYIREHQLYGSR